ncbi:hypothetical protein QYM36_002728 [Artemia franciscana]|uniref:Uncharacterized protein n=1 Tax=Artemia franciscana TaxID=6661 RepID=A0AA88LDG5_ARTSF|nr:hypothetical protein QYM36_002728 [Artemia franciscana]
MMKMGLYKVYTMNTESAEEAKKMAYGVKLMDDFRKWAALYGEEKLKKFQNPFGCVHKIVYFVLEGTNYNWKNLHSASRLELFFAKLAECGMQGSSRKKYAQGFRQFIDYISSRGSEGPENLYLTNVTSVVRALGHLDKKHSSLATTEKRRKEHQRAFDPHSFHNEDYIKLKAGVEEFMAPVLLRLSRNRLLEGDLPHLTAYLCFLVSFLFGHRPGVPENMTVEEFMNRQATDEIREIVREETFCHHEAQRRKMNIIVKKLPEQEGVDDVTQVKQIIQKQLQLPVPTILKATRLGEKLPTTQNSVSRYQPLLIQLPESEIALKRQIVQMSYVKRKSLQTFFRNDVPKRFRTAGSISEPLSRGPKN